MAKADTTSLQSIHDQLGSVLEARVTELMTQIKTAQALTRQIARTEEEIERQRMLRERLEGDLGPLKHEAASLATETEALRAELEDVSDAVDRLSAIRDELKALAAATNG